MPEHLTQYARATAMHAQTRIAHIIDIIERQENADALLKASLSPDMFNLAEQLSVAIGFTVRSVIPLFGEPAGDMGIQDNISDLRASLALAGKINRNLTVKSILELPRSIIHKAGKHEISQTPEDYLHQFAIPNLWFHISMAYAILRAEGVEISKGDFDGVHHYPQGFAF